MAGSCAGKTGVKNCMRIGNISIYYGAGKGKTSLAVGRGLRAVGEDLRVVMIQFLDHYNSKEMALLQKLEPDFRIFRFEKDRSAQMLSEAQVDEALLREISGEIRNAFNFARKIADTGECEMLILDGILDCIEKGYLQEAELQELMEKRPEYMDMILTGETLAMPLAKKADLVYQIVRCNGE